MENFIFCAVNSSRKKMFILGDSIVKHVEGWCLNKRMRYTISVRSILRVTTKVMKLYLKGCLEGSSADAPTRDK